MDPAVKEYGFEEMEEGQTFSFSVIISAEDIDRYAEGDKR